MINIDLRSRVPIFEQIKNQVMELIFLGVLKPDDQLPSIRALAKDLKLNVNTVKKAFQDLEGVGVIYTVSGRGSFVSESSTKDSQLKTKAVEDIKLSIRIGRSNGVSKAEILEIINEVFD